MESRSILFIGELPEADTAGWPGSAAGVAGVRHVPDLSAAIDAVSELGEFALELLVLCEPRPGTWSEAEITALRAAAPLCRIVRASGSWCEGQGRSARSLAGCVATYWHQWLPRFAGERAALDAGRNPSWAQPLTTTPEEQLLAGVSSDRPGTHQGTISIQAATAGTAGALAAICRGAGYFAVILRSDGPRLSGEACALLWDTPPDALRVPECIERMRTLAGRAPIVALTGFPRWDDVLAARAAGIAAIVSKPYRTADLLWQLGQCKEKQVE